jgi:shikimate kinase
MGAGKTTVGKQLAKMLDATFIDLDQAIAEGERRTVKTLFEQVGESGFRGMERAWLNRITEQHPKLVCATGGGTPCFYDNMQYMNAHGITVYLEMDVSSIVYRLSHSNEERPLIAHLSPDELTRFVSRHLDERSEFYHEAQITFGALGMNRLKLQNLVDRIRAASAKS